jgi:hypothetical protein
MIWTNSIATSCPLGKFGRLESKPRPIDLAGGGDIIATMTDRSPTTDRPGPAARLWRDYVLIALLAGFVYVLTAQRGPAWQDSGIFQRRALDLDLFGQFGLALAHPLLISLGKLFSFLPVGPLPWRINLVSAVAAALAVANVATLVMRLNHGRRLAGWVAAGTLAVCHTLWWLATISESQAILLAIFTTELHVLLWLVWQPSRRAAALLGLLNGVGLLTHDLSLLALPAYGLTVIGLCWRKRLPASAVAWMVGGYLLGAGGFLAMVAVLAGRVGVWAAVSSALFGDRWRGSVLNGSLRPVAMGCGYMLYNFPNLALPLAVAGLGVMRRRLRPTLRRALGYLLAVYLLFALRYRVADQFMFFLPAYAMIVVMAGLGFDRLVWQQRRAWLGWCVLAGIVITPIIYAAAPTLWQRADLPLPGRKDLAVRDAARYWLTPWKLDEDSAGQFARAALTEAGPGGTIVADSTSLPPLEWTQRVQGQGRSVRLLGDGQADEATIPPGTTRVFLISHTPPYYPAWLDQAATIQRDPGSGVLYAVQWRRPPSGP